MSESLKSVNKYKEEKPKGHPQTYNLQQAITRFNLKIKGEKSKSKEDKMPSITKQPTTMYQGKIQCNN